MRHALRKVIVHIRRAAACRKLLEASGQTVCKCGARQGGTEVERLQGLGFEGCWHMSALLGRAQPLWVIELTALRAELCTPSIDRSRRRDGEERTRQKPDGTKPSAAVRPDWSLLDRMDVYRLSNAVICGGGFLESSTLAGRLVRSEARPTSGSVDQVREPNRIWSRRLRRWCHAGVTTRGPASNAKQRLPRCPARCQNAVLSKQSSDAK